PDTRYTTAILDLLGAMGVKATFFVKGNNIPNQEWVLTRMIREGHLIGNHSFTHPNLRNLSLANLKEEIKKTEQTVAEVTGRQPAMVRPPYGEMSEAGLDWLVKEGYSMVNWSVDSEDWRSTHEDQILIKTLPNLRPGSIILLHSAGGTGQDLTPTVKATEDLIYTLWGLGYQIVPLNELLKIQPYK
ncbi:MAG TPA: polysaccharide deacetylase family protein, partial [Bacillota bacterium]|nr:polysaccharide deacetylase family protein [Bacillota bacterium]